MKKLALIAFVLFSLITNSQTVSIKGKIIYYQNLRPLPLTEIFFDSVNHTIADEQGIFDLHVPVKVITDTLKFRFIGCFDINIINLPLNEDLIDLGMIPFFEYFTGYSMTHFDCADNDYECKEKEKLFWIKEQERRDLYFTTMNSIIEYFDYWFQGKKYKINCQNHCIDLKNENIE